MPDQDRRPCPYCGERIKLAALICRFCNREFSANQRNQGRRIGGAAFRLPTTVDSVADIQSGGEPKSQSPRQVSGAKIFLLGTAVLLILVFRQNIEYLPIAELIAGCYFLPTIFAVLGKKRNSSAICVLNLFLGWTLIGWVVSLVWATTHD